MLLSSCLSLKSVLLAIDMVHKFELREANVLSTNSISFLQYAAIKPTRPSVSLQTHSPRGTELRRHDLHPAQNVQLLILQPLRPH
jgi:hypothetical protein